MDSYYDLFDDWGLIESSFLKQYGIRLRSVNDMPWNEFCSYLSGLMEDTPLGRMVTIRSETDKETLKHFSKEQKKIRADWQRRKANQVDTSSKSYEEVIEGFKKMFENLSKGGV